MSLPPLVGLDMVIASLRRPKAEEYHLLLQQECRTAEQAAAMLHGLITYNQTVLELLGSALKRASELPTDRGRLDSLRTALQTQLELDAVALEDLRQALGDE